VDARRDPAGSDIAELGRRIRQARLQAGLSEEELAARIGISGVTLHLYETGVADARDHLEEIAAALGTPLPVLSHAEPSSPPQEAATASAETEQEAGASPVGRETEEASLGREREGERRVPVDDVEAGEQAQPGSFADEAALGERERDLREREDELARRQEELVGRESELARREEKLVRREERLRRREEELEERQIELGLPAQVRGPEEESISQPESPSASEPKGPAPHASPPALAEAEAMETTIAGDDEPRRLPPSRTGALALSLDLSGVRNLAGVHQIGGASVLVDTFDGRQVRVTASHDYETGRFVSTYEVARKQSWQGRDILVWENAPSYRPRRGAHVEDCLEAALAEVDAGERSPQELAAEDELAAADDQVALARPTAARRRRGFLTWLHGRH